VAQALEILWQATGGIGPPRLHPFVPELLDRLARDGELRLAPEAKRPWFGGTGVDSPIRGRTYTLTTGNLRAQITTPS
jgi:hypothetical protein